jgi:DNA-binding MarR family transcriptional regulator
MLAQATSRADGMISAEGTSPVEGATSAEGTSAEHVTGRGFTPLERAAWVGLVVVQGRLRRRLDAALQERHRLSHAEFEVLFLLTLAPGHRRRLSELSSMSMLTLSGMSRLVDRLEQAGLVTRTVAPEDRRGAYAQLTEEGQARFRAAQATETDVVRTHLLSLYDERELETLAALWRRFFERDRPHAPVDGDPAAPPARDAGPPETRARGDGETSGSP